MGLFSSIANIFGANKVKKASRQAAQAQITGLQNGINAIGAQQAQNTASIDGAIGGLQPFNQSGIDAQGGIDGLLGLQGPEAQAQALAQLQESPLFASLFGNGQDAILQNASATGGLRGGNTQRSLADFGSDLFAQIIQQQLTSLGGVADRGAGAGGSILSGRLNQAGLANANAGNTANLLAGQGEAQAGGILGAAKGSLMKYGAVADIGNQLASMFTGFPGLGAGGGGGGVTFPGSGGSSMPGLNLGSGPGLF